jgi:hypothetical protein
MRNIECLLSELYEMNELLNKLPDSNEKKYMQESYAKQLESALYSIENKYYRKIIEPKKGNLDNSHEEYINLYKSTLKKFMPLMIQHMNTLQN